MIRRLPTSTRYVGQKDYPVSDKSSAAVLTPSTDSCDVPCALSDSLDDLKPGATMAGNVPRAVTADSCAAGSPTVILIGLVAVKLVDSSSRVLPSTRVVIDDLTASSASIVSWYAEDGATRTVNGAHRATRENGSKGLVSTCDPPGAGADAEDATGAAAGAF